MVKATINVEPEVIRYILQQALTAPVRTNAVSAKNISAFLDKVVETCKHIGEKTGMPVNITNENLQIGQEEIPADIPKE